MEAPPIHFSMESTPDLRLGSSSPARPDSQASWSQSLGPYVATAAGVATVALLWRVATLPDGKPGGPGADVSPSHIHSTSSHSSSSGVPADGTETRALRAGPPDLSHYEHVGLPCGAHGWTRTFGLLANPAWSTEMAGPQGVDENDAEADHAPAAHSHTMAVAITTTSASHSVCLDDDVNTTSAAALAMSPSRSLSQPVLTEPTHEKKATAVDAEDDNHDGEVSSHAASTSSTVSCGSSSSGLSRNSARQTATRPGLPEAAAVKATATATAAAAVAVPSNAPRSPAAARTEAPLAVSATHDVSAPHVATPPVSRRASLSLWERLLAPFRRSAPSAVPAKPRAVPPLAPAHGDGHVIVDGHGREIHPANFHIRDDNNDNNEDEASGAKSTLGGQDSSSITIYAPPQPAPKAGPSRPGTLSLSRSLGTGVNVGPTSGLHGAHVNRPSISVDAGAAGSAAAGTMSSQLLQKHISYLVGSAALVRDVEELAVSSPSHHLHRKDNRGEADEAERHADDDAKEQAERAAATQQAIATAPGHRRAHDHRGGDDRASGLAAMTTTLDEKASSSESLSTAGTSGSHWARASPPPSPLMTEPVRARGRTDTALRHRSHGAGAGDVVDGSGDGLRVSWMADASHAQNRFQTAKVRRASASPPTSLPTAGPLSMAEQLAILENRRERQWHMTREWTRMQAHGHTSVEVLPDSTPTTAATQTTSPRVDGSEATPSPAPPAPARPVSSQSLGVGSAGAAVVDATTTTNAVETTGAALSSRSSPRTSETLIPLSRGAIPTAAISTESHTATPTPQSTTPSPAVTHVLASSTSSSHTNTANTAPTNVAASAPLAGDNHDRRVDDLRVKHQDGTDQYSISLTYHDAATGSSRTIDARALPALQPQNAPPVLVNGAVTAHRATPLPAATHSAPGSSSPALALPRVGSSASTGADSTSRRLAAAAAAATSREGSATTPTARALRTSNPSSNRTSGVIATAAGPTTTSTSTSTSASATVAAAPGTSPTKGTTNSGSSSTTTTAGGKGPFGAPLPSTEPTHGPRLQGVAGRRGEMVIGAFLGGGACGKVYECLNTETNQLIAVKQLVFDAKDAKLRQRLRQLELELEVLTLSAHHKVEHIVGFHGAEKRGHSVLMYLEYCSNGSLLDYMADGKSKDAPVWGGLGTTGPPAPDPSTTHHAISAAACRTVTERFKEEEQDEESRGHTTTTNANDNNTDNAANANRETNDAGDEEAAARVSSHAALASSAAAAAVTTPTTTGTHRDRKSLHEADSDAVVRVSESGFTATAPEKVATAATAATAAPTNWPPRPRPVHTSPVPESPAEVALGTRPSCPRYFHSLTPASSSGSLADGAGVVLGASSATAAAAGVHTSGAAAVLARPPLSPSSLGVLDKVRPASPCATTTTCSSTCGSETLSEMLRPQMPPLSIEEVQRFTREVLLGLRFMHAHNYAHLDIKTANVLITANEECRVADLGCAMRLCVCPNEEEQGAAGEDGTAASTLAAHNSPNRPCYPVLKDYNTITELRGTALYMAPEMIRFERALIGSPADIWSLGCVVMEMSTGSAPWRHLSRDKLRVLFRVGSAREDLPLPTLMRTWASEADERLSQLDMEFGGPSTMRLVTSAQALRDDEDDGGEANDDEAMMPGHKLSRDTYTTTTTTAAAADTSAVRVTTTSDDDSDELSPPSRGRRRLEEDGAPTLSRTSTCAGDNIHTLTQSLTTVAAVSLPGAIPITPGGFLAEYVADPQRQLTSASHSAFTDSHSSSAPTAATAGGFGASTAVEGSPTCSTCTTTAPPHSPLQTLPTDGNRTPMPGSPMSTGTTAWGVNAEAATVTPMHHTTVTEQYEAQQRRILRLYVELERFVACCLHVLPEDRWTAEELLEHPFLTL